MLLCRVWRHGGALYKGFKCNVKASFWRGEQNVEIDDLFDQPSILIRDYKIGHQSGQFNLEKR